MTPETLKNPDESNKNRILNFITKTYLIQSDSKNKEYIKDWKELVEVEERIAKKHGATNMEIETAKIKGIHDEERIKLFLNDLEENIKTSLESGAEPRISMEEFELLKSSQKK